MAFCWNQTRLERTFDVKPSCTKCRYHRRDRAMPLSQMGPSGLCLEAFHSIYPTAFSMFTAPAADVENGVKRVCPAGEVVVSLRRRAFRQLKHLPEQMLRRVASLVLPVEVLRWRIFVKVEQVGECPYQYAPGDEFEVNIGNTRDLCPAAGTSFFPYFVPFIDEAEEAAPTVNCPDHLTDVRASAGEVEEVNGSPPGDSDSKVFCRSHSDVVLEVVRSNGCPVPLHEGERLSVADLLKKTGLPCLSYINVIAPYVQTLREGGRLGFYSETYRAAMVQCPSPSHKVVTRVEQEEDGPTIHFSIESTNLDCPLGMNKGARFSFNDDEGYFWLRALACLSPYLLNETLTDGMEVAFSPEGPEIMAVFRIHSSTSAPIKLSGRPGEGR